MSTKHLVGYARVSTTEQNPAAQLDMLNAAGCERVFVEAASGAQRNRPELTKALDYMRKGDVLVVWRLDHLARSVRQLVDTAGHYVRGASSYDPCTMRSTPARPLEGLPSTCSQPWRSSSVM